MSDLQKIEYSRKLDLNFAVDGEEKAKGYVCENPVTVNEIQVDQNKQGQQGSSSLHVDFGEENPTSCHSESQFVSTEFDQYDARTNNSCEQGEMDELPHSNFCKSSFEFKAQTVHHERETEDSAHSQESPLTADRNKLEETECDPDVDRPNTSPQDEKENDRLVDNSMYEFTNSPDKEVLGKTIGHQTGNLSTYPSSILGEGESQPKNERYHYVANSPSGSWKLDMPHFIPHSPGSTHRRSTSPAMVNQTLVSPEGSPCIHMSLNGHKPPSSSENVPDQLLCPTQPRETHSSSPERSNLAKRISPPHHLSPSATRTSASPKRSRPGSRHKNGSSLQRMPQSTDSSYSPRKNNKPEKSVIRSHIPRRDSSSAYGRDYHDRSRSRSPYMRDHYGSPRRRYSPRRRSSPGYHSLRHSPRRRPWFPPPNRRNGVGKPGNNLFVAGFSFLTTERDLERKFSRFGHVRDVRIVRDKRSGDSRGFGFLSLESDEDADAAIRALDETEWNGRVILVEKSKSTR